MGKWHFHRDQLPSSSSEQLIQQTNMFSIQLVCQKGIGVSMSSISGGTAPHPENMHPPLSFGFLIWNFLWHDCRFYRYIFSRNDDRSFCDGAWRFHLNNIAKAIVIVDVETARSRNAFSQNLVRVELVKRNTATDSNALVENSWQGTIMNYWTQRWRRQLLFHVKYTLNLWMIINTWNGISASSTGLQIRDSNLR
jgi:hypothetical protein